MTGSGGRGRFIAFEGGEASGKSTQAALLADHLGAVLTREPGGTAIGEKIRALVLDPVNVAMADRTEALLMAAARAQHVAELVAPALATGRDVVTDRFTASSIAYQAHGRGLDPDEVLGLSQWATAGLRPDLYVLLAVPRSVATDRLTGDLDRLEQADEAFHEAVLKGFEEQADRDPARWMVLDGTRPVDEVQRDVRIAVHERLSAPPDR